MKHIRLYKDFITEGVEAGVVNCEGSGCDWHWNLADGLDGGETNAYLCHKCWHDNTPVVADPHHLYTDWEKGLIKAWGGVLYLAYHTLPAKLTNLVDFTRFKNIMAEYFKNSDSDEDMQDWLSDIPPTLDRGKWSLFDKARVDSVFTQIANKTLTPGELIIYRTSDNHRAGWNSYTLRNDASYSYKNRLTLAYKLPPGFPVIFADGIADKDEVIVNLPPQYLHQPAIAESIRAADAYQTWSAVQTVINNHRDLAFISTMDNPIYDPNNRLELAAMRHGLANGLSAIEVAGKPDGRAWVLYRHNRPAAQQLADYARSHGGYLSDSTPAEASLVGTLLGYEQADIEEFIKRVYHQ